MKRGVTASLLLLAFAVTAGQFLHRVVAPLQTPEYFVGGVVRPFLLPEDVEGGGKSLYVRRRLHLTQHPRHAWIQVVGTDVMLIYVNGEVVSMSRDPHRGENAMLIDLTPFLRRGVNAIAVVANQRRLRRPPRLAITGECFTAGDEVVSLDDGWKLSDHFEHDAEFWYDEQFDDGDWPAAAGGPEAALRGQVTIPPSSVRTPPRGHWISPPAATAGRGALRREFQIDSRPHSGWLRVSASAPYSLAVNGRILDLDHSNVLAPPPHRPVLKTYDISPHLRRGDNVIAVMLSSPGETPHISADFEVTDKRGRTNHYLSDGAWLAAAGAPQDWMRRRRTTTAWGPCRDEAGPMNSRQVLQERAYTRDQAGAPFWSGTTLRAGGWMLLTGLLAWLGCWSIGRLIRKRNCKAPWALPYIALALPSALLLCAALSTYDLSIGQSDVFQGRWLAAAAGLVLAQWGLMVVMSRGDSQPAARRVAVSSRWARVAALMVVASVGLWLRTRDILSEPMHHDEVGSYFFSRSVLEYGFPGGQADPEIPFGYCATSELVYMVNAPFAMLFDEARLVIRVPAVCWSIYTLLLLYFVGSRLFSWPVGMVAATLFSVSPYLVGMANFGRYFCQLQFFGLLTCYFFYLTIQGRGPINRRALWATALSFTAMYLSWEGSGFMAVGMIVAALAQRRGRLKTIFLCPSIYASLAVVGAVFLAQNSHRTFQQVHRLWYGTGISDVKIMPMWRYPRFDLLFYVREATWVSDSLFPLAGLTIAIVLAARHPRREPLRVFLIILMVTCMAMVSLLPLRATRYVYHVTPLMILASAVVVVSLGRSLVRLARSIDAPAWCGRMAQPLAAMSVVALLLPATGVTFDALELEAYRTSAYRLGMLKFPHWEKPLRHLRKNLRQDDVVIALHPHIVDMTMRLAKDNPVAPDWKTDYWLQSVMVLQATLADSAPLPLDRRAGAKMISDRETLERVLDEHPRVWYLTIRHSHNNINHSDVSEYLRQRMEVTYEDAATVVLLKDDHRNRTAETRLKDEEKSEKAQTYLLK